MKLKRVVIAGIGFGGLSAARTLAGKRLDVVMVDRHNYHLFQPLLYQVATAGLEQESIAYPVRALARNWKNTKFRLCEVTGADFKEKLLLTDSGAIEYDYLVFAAGSRTNFFGNSSVERHAFDLKQMSDSEALRNHVLTVFEKASLVSDNNERSKLLTFVIVGGGPTGVEFAGALRELIIYVLSRDYPEISMSETRIILIEASSAILTAMPEMLRNYALKRLQGMGIEVMLNTPVTGADENSVTLGDGKVIATKTLFWSAGVAASELAGKIGVSQGPGGRVKVLPDLSIEGLPDVFVAGDMACVIQDGRPLPMMAPVASQQGKYVADAILARERGEKTEPFRYIDKGSMATIGRSSAVATTHGFSFSGYLAWLAWLLLHLYYLIGFRNRILVMMNWAYYYFFYERQVRLITDTRKETVKGADKV